MALSICCISSASNCCATALIACGLRGSALAAALSWFSPWNDRLLDAAAPLGGSGDRGGLGGVVMADGLSTRSYHFELGVQRTRRLHGLQNGDEVVGRRAHGVECAHHGFERDAGLEHEQIGLVRLGFHIGFGHHRRLPRAERVGLADFVLRVDGDRQIAVRHRAGAQGDVLPQHHGAAAGVDHHFCRWRFGRDVQRFDLAEKGGAVARSQRRIHLNDPGVERRGRARAETLVDGIGHAAGGAEAGGVERKGDRARLVEIVRHGAFDRGAVGDHARGEKVDLGAVAPRSGAEAADHHTALGHGVGLAVSAFERGHQQGAAGQAGSIAHRRDGHVDLLARLRKRRQVGSDHHRGHVFRLQVGGYAGRQVDAQALKHGEQRLGGVGHLRGLVAGAAEADHQAVADELIHPHPLHAGEIADGGGVRGQRRGAEQAERRQPGE